MSAPATAPGSNATSTDRSGGLQATIEAGLPERLAVGRGNAALLKGRCSHGSSAIRRLSVLVEQEEHEVMAHGMPGAGAEGGDLWWAIVPFSPVSEPTTAHVRLRASLANGCDEVAHLGTIDLRPGPEIVPGVGSDADQPLIAVCMATYNPPLDLFDRQIDSIRRQSYPNWVCVISDDGSDSAALEAIQRRVAGDSRFVVHPYSDRLGAYGNFERALELAPPHAAHIALADQDDRWYPEKLESLLAGIGDARLVYSDMRVVDRQQRVLSETYWRYRRNQCSDLASLLIGNTVTGGAALFRRELLDYVLPFPPRVGRAFHDHWIATVALAAGSINYVDRPLHDYVQHPGATMGHAGANAGRGASASRLGDALIRSRRLAGRLIRPEARDRYFYDYCRIALAAQVLDLRCAELMSPEKRLAVERLRACDHSTRAAAWLLARTLRATVSGNETMGVDRSVMAGITWKRLAHVRRRRIGQARP